MKKIGWMPYCLSCECYSGKAVLGFWPKWFSTNKRELKSNLYNKADGFKFKIVPVFVKE